LGQITVSLLPFARRVAVVLIEEADFAVLQFVGDAQIIDVLVGVIGDADVGLVESDIFGPFFNGRHRHPGTLAVEVPDAAGGQGGIQEVRTPHEELHVADLELAEGDVEVQIGPFPFEVFLGLGGSAANTGRSLGAGLGLARAARPGLIAPVLFQGVEAGDEFQTFHDLELDVRPEPLGIPGVRTAHRPAVTGRPVRSVRTPGARVSKTTRIGAYRCGLLTFIQQRGVVHVRTEGVVLAAELYIYRRGGHGEGHDQPEGQ